jgi:hypothetical protein
VQSGALYRSFDIAHIFPVHLGTSACIGGTGSSRPTIDETDATFA